MLSYGAGRGCSERLRFAINRTRYAVSYTAMVTNVKQGPKGSCTYQKNHAAYSIWVPKPQWILELL